MSLIPFVLELADELNNFTTRYFSNSMMDVDDVGFGLNLHELREQQQQQHQQQQQQQQHNLRRPNIVSQLLLSNNNRQQQRHHPYLQFRGGAAGAAAAAAAAAYNAKSQQLFDFNDKGGTSGAGSSSSNSVGNAGGDKEAPASIKLLNRGSFQISMNVKQFGHHDLHVKIIDRCIVVEGRHDDKEDGHGVISRHFIRKYILPKGYDPNEVCSTLSSDGILTVKAPFPGTTAGLERIVQIQQVGPYQCAVKEANKEQQTSTIANSQQQQQQQKEQEQKQPPLLQKQQNLMDESNGGNDVENDIDADIGADDDDDGDGDVDGDGDGDADANADGDVEPKGTDDNNDDTAMLISSVIMPVTLDAIMADENIEDSNANNGSNNTIDNGITNIPIVAVTTIPGDEVAVAIGTAIPDDSNNAAVDDNGATDGTVDDATSVDNNLVVAEQQPIQTDLIAAAAADAAILLAKTQCENGSNKTANEEIIN